MFTGIVQNQGKVVFVKTAGSKRRLKIRFLKPEKKVQLGESIAVSGVCLTVAAFDKTAFEADVVPATLKSTTLGTLSVGERVNLERALCFGDRVGGHYVSGHVEGVGRVASVEKYGRSWQIGIRVPARLRERMPPKGSVAVDGVSLTLQEACGGRITIAVIPHTLKATTLGTKQVGDGVNLESDLRFHPVPQRSRSPREGASALRRQIKALTGHGF